MSRSARKSSTEGCPPRAPVLVSGSSTSMPYNSEQVSIVEKLETSDGVVVHGAARHRQDPHHCKCYLSLSRPWSACVLVTFQGGEEALRVLAGEDSGGDPGTVEGGAADR